MGSRYPRLPGTWGHKAGLGLEPVALGDLLSQQTPGWGEGRCRGGFGVQVMPLLPPPLIAASFGAC